MIYLMADHAGRPLLPAVRRELNQRRQIFLDRTSRRVKLHDDYPLLVRQAVAGFQPDRDQAILVCGSGTGMAMAANKIAGLRAVAAVTPRQAGLARQDEDANVLTLGSWLVKPAAARRILDVWFTTKVSQAARHHRRRRQLAALDR